MQLVTCDKHGKGPGYCVCLHVINGAKVAYFERATEKELGVAVCEDCERREPTADDMALVCAGCYATEIQPRQ